MSPGPRGWGIGVVALAGVLALLALAPIDRAASRAWESGRAVALTFDDLPVTPVDGGCDPALARYVTARLLAALGEARAPATGFVNGSRTCGEPPEALRDSLLGAWLDAGHDLGNHTWSHPDLHRVSLSTYLADVERGAAFVETLLQDRGRRLVWFRHPFLHAGDTPAKKEGLADRLAERGWRVAPVTIDNQEWVYAYVYERAREAGDEALAERVAAAYLDHVEQAFAYFEARSVDVLGREIPQVLLLHANRLNADRLDELVVRIRARGYRIVPLAEALRDPAYDRPDPYLGSGGPSWIERWGVSEGEPAGEGPREDPWVREAYRGLSR